MERKTLLLNPQEYKLLLGTMNRVLDEMVEDGDDTEDLVDLIDKIASSKDLDHYVERAMDVATRLPVKSYHYDEHRDRIIRIKRGSSGYYPHDLAVDASIGYGKNVARANADLGVTPAQAAAMYAGSLFGWHTPSADPRSYDEKGGLI